MSRPIAVVSYKIDDEIKNKFINTEEELVKLKARLNEFDISFMVKRL